MNLTATTERFCICDLRNPTTGLITVAKLFADCLNRHPDMPNVEIRYVNIVNVDPESPDYNPDGMIGSFRILTTPKPQIEWEVAP